MKVECNNDGWVTNFEVYASLKAREIRKSSKRPNNAVEIETQVLEYLQQETSVTKLTPESICAFFREMQPYDLAEAEILELANHTPTEDYQAYLVRAQEIV